MKLVLSIILVSAVISVCIGQETESVAPEKPKYVQPVPRGSVHFSETFDSAVIGSKWIKSKAKKDGVDETLAKYDGEWAIEPSTESALEGDKGLVLKSRAKHHAISAKLDKTFKFTDKKPLIVQ